MKLLAYVYAACVIIPVGAVIALFLFLFIAAIF